MISNCDLFLPVVIIICPKLERRAFVLKAYDLGMTNGEYVFLTMDVTPVDDVASIANVWRGADSRDQAARRAFESVFHVGLLADVFITCKVPIVRLKSSQQY